MPSSDYAAATGGTLKLKGGMGIEKKKKKKKNPATAANTSASASASPAPVTTTTASNDPTPDPERIKSPLSSSELETLGKEVHDSGAGAQSRYKTEAERRHEERRRKRLEDRLRREGVKTHKERVEELNKYLSGLSEHHDMPKIGPG